MRTHFRPDVSVQSFSEKEIALLFPHTVAKWKNPSVSLQKRLKRLMEDGSDDLYEEEMDELPNLFILLETLKSASLLSYTVIHETNALMTLIPYQNGFFEFKKTQIDPDLPLQLSRFAYLRRKEDQYVIESPLLAAIIVIKNAESFAFFYALSTHKSLNTLISEFSHLSKETVIDLFTLFHQAYLLSDSDQEVSLSCWEFHDLLFHTKSRCRSDAPSGATFRFLNKIAPKEAIQGNNEPVISLYKPDLSHLMKTDLPFTEVMERRKSIREHGKVPITKEQLGEFFYRAARVKGFQNAQNYEATIRPYPGGGACYELELYIIINRCSDLDRGFYRYQPVIHALVPCSIQLEEMNQLLSSASIATRKIEYPQVLILIAARFQRISWKYESMAYSLILKNTGVLLQTMYLTATAMNLAPCAVGAANSDHFSRIARTNYYEETTVGEFILGTKSDG